MAAYIADELTHGETIRRPFARIEQGCRWSIAFSQGEGLETHRPWPAGPPDPLGTGTSRIFFAHQRWPARGLDAIAHAFRHAFKR